MSTVGQDESWRGKVGRLHQDELEAFLAEGRIARLGCLDADGWPYVVPVWHEWDGDGFFVIPRMKSAWAQFLT
ncbi:MAG: pyridoxamine 5'-phosphate oxidase family protein, partial [Actinomycetota bacterium]|nr:pyridoxamine 5'-phosphate oxidase family protein [Actinomycetota bacterium]